MKLTAAFALANAVIDLMLKIYCQVLDESVPYMVAEQVKENYIQSI